jgi:hypothetical protein
MAGIILSARSNKKETYVCAFGLLYTEANILYKRPDERDKKYITAIAMLLLFFVVNNKYTITKTHGRNAAICSASFSENCNL